MLEESDFKAQLDAWITIQKSHAIANGVYVAAVNRIGHEGPKNGGINFWGNSFIVDPFGKMIAHASGDKEEILIAEVDTDLIDQKRRYWPFYRDRRIDSYEEILQRYGK
jgi:N-carbamoylputrescine amidase